MATKKQTTDSAATKAAATKKANKATKAEPLKKGQTAVFIGWDGEAPEDSDEILVGMVGKVRSVSADEVEVAIEIDGDNVIVPFSPKEVALATKEDIKKAAELVADEDEDEDEEYEDEDADADADEEEAEDEDEEVDEDEEEEEEEEPEPVKPVRQQSTGKLADGGDKAAIKELTKRAKAHGIDLEEVESWVAVEKAIKAADKEASKAATKPELILTTSVQSEIGDSGKTAVAAAKKLVETAERTYFTLGGVLAYINQNATFEKVKVDGEFPYKGKEGFEAFCVETLNIKYRKATYLIAIYEAFTNAGLTERKLQTIGWSKAKELVAILNAEPEQANEWIEKAKKVGTAELQEQVKTRLTTLGAKVHGNSKNQVKSVVCKFVVHEDEGEVVKEALALAKEQAETESDSAAFAYILKEWLALQS